MDILIDRGTKDASIVNGDLAIVIGVEEAAQRAADRLQTFRREWFLDLNFGIDYLKDVLKKSPSLTLIRSIFTVEIVLAIGTDAVLSSLEVVLISATRELDVTFTLRDFAGQEEVERTVVIG